MFTQKIFVCLCTALVLTNLSAKANILTVNDGTPVKLRLNRNVSSADATTGEMVDFEVLEDVTVNDVTLISRGSAAIGTVTEAQAKRRMGRAGKLNITIDHVRMANGAKVPLRAVKEGKGGSNAGKVTTAVVATSIVFFPAAPLFLLAHGKDITIPKGTEVTAYVSGDFKFDPLKLNAPSATPAPDAKVLGKAMTNADILSLKKFGLSDETVIEKIRGSHAAYQLEVEDLGALKNEGLSEAVIKEMILASGRH